ncbi:RNA-directed DNA polymerase, eukaryota, reverse transcriptase zinc-binding domain protein [Tanacetum coccineum]
MENMDLFSVKRCWGNLSFDYVHSEAVGNSGGILCVWDPNSFHKENSTISDSFVMVRGVWCPTGQKFMLIAVYAPHDSKVKHMLWDYLQNEILKWKGEVVVMGDFNEVRFKSDRFGSVFNAHEANVFNSFITNSNLVEILLRESHLDYGPIPFKIFHYWFDMDGFNKTVEDAWKEYPGKESNAIRYLMGKLKYLKGKIREWNGVSRSKVGLVKTQYKKELEGIDEIIDRGKGDEEVIGRRVDIINKIHDIENIQSMEMAQKAKVRWAIEGDENSRFFHGMLNKRRSTLNIRGVMADGSWIDNPIKVKQEFFNHFNKRFCHSDITGVKIQMDFPKQISEEEKQEIECEVTNEEIKRAVWECGSDKAPGPDGFTFAKILANRLVGVLNGIVNEVQSAFILDRHILDGPFILNEVLQWCKSKHKQALIFKVDFEKAYDSVKWDFLDDVLNKFSFGNKWCKWIQCCLRSSRGSILVNGSPTEEFQFGKGLKQGDPLSPFLFILVMESLHISFQRIVDAGRFHGIKMGGGSVNLSHMFYADDAVFIGQWCESNITTLVHVLECFHKASGLRINMCKSKIMGVHVDGDMVKNAAKKIGCLVLKTPFSYLGSIVGGSMHCRQSWIDIVEKVKKRLSKWKLQSLSIGGRLTLVKAVLGTIPIFNFSIFKVPRCVLRELEGIRRQFFNGHEPNSKKVNWVSWEKVLLAKERGGLGVSSLFAMNRGLLFKWIWKFRTQGNSLWARVIKAIHGVDGCLGVNSMERRPSCWMSIIKEMDVLKTKGIDLMNHMRIKVGNGESTSFWEDKWCDAGVLKDRYPRAFALENCKSIKVATKLSQPEFSHSFRRLPRGGCEQNQVNELEDLMRLVVLSPIEDRWMWGLENSGLFSVASIRRHIDDKMLSGWNCKTRWINYVPNKVNVLAWKVMTDSLPTRWWDVPEPECESYEDWLVWVTNVRLPLKNKKLFEGAFYVLWPSKWLLDIGNNKVMKSTWKKRLLDNLQECAVAHDGGLFKV